MGITTSEIKIPIKVDFTDATAKLCLEVCNAYAEEKGMEIVFVVEENRYCFRYRKMKPIEDESSIGLEFRRMMNEK